MVHVGRQLKRDPLGSTKTVQNGALLAIAAVAALGGITLATTADSWLSRVLDPLPAVLLALASLGFLTASHSRSQIRTLALFCACSAAFVALFGACLIGLYTPGALHGADQARHEVALGAFYLLGGSYLVWVSGVKVRLERRE